MMEDWKQRLLDEYLETKSRYENLKAYNLKLEIKDRIEMRERNYHACNEDEERARSMVRKDLLISQQHAMEDYLRLLELRMTLERMEIKV